MRTLSIWFLAIRPKTLIACISPVFIGSALAWHDPCFSWSLFGATLATALCIQITTNLANDYFDFVKGADSASRIGPVRVTQAGLVSLKQMRVAILLSLCTTALVGFTLLISKGALLLSLFIGALLLSIGYTTGPVPLAYLGLGDICVFLFFGPVAAAGSFMIQTGTLSTTALLAGIAPGALSTAILTANNLRDQHEDARCGKKSVVVRFGELFGKREFLGAVALSVLTPLFFFSVRGALLSLLTAPLALLLARRLLRIQSAHEYNLLLANTAKHLLIYTVLFCLLFTL